VTTQIVRGDRCTSQGKLCELCVNARVIMCKWRIPEITREFNYSRVLIGFFQYPANGSYKW